MKAVNVSLSACLTALAILLASAGQASAANPPRTVWESGVPEAYFQRFLEFYQADPSALQRWVSGRNDISSDQLDRTLAALDTTQFSYLYPMTIKGYELPKQLGHSIDTLSLMAVRAGKLVPIPFQIDEFDRSGLIWIDGHNDHDAEGEPGIFDDFDELVFMFRDGGREPLDPQQHAPEQGRVLQEIRLDSPRNAPRYVYLVKDNPARSDANYVQVDLDKGTITTTIMAMRYSPKDFTQIESMAPRLGPYKDQNVLDNIYINISTGILNQNLRVNLDTNDNIRATPIAVHDGPVRASMLIRTRIRYAYMPTFFNQKFQVNFNEQSVTVPSRFAIGSMRVLQFFLRFLREPRIHFAVDFKNLEGARVTFDAVHNDGQWGIVDGVMSDFEQQMNRTRLPGDWLHLDSGQGWDMFFSNHMPVVPEGLFDAFLDGMEMNMFYLDDKDNHTDWERHPGATPRLGFETQGLPRTAISLLGAIPKLDFEEMDSLGEGILALVEADRKGRAFNRYDSIVSERMQALNAEGRFTTITELADGFINDLDRMNFTGIPRATLNRLLRQAIYDTVPAPDQIEHGKVLARMVQLAEQDGVDIRRLRYATMDNTLWFPAWTGAGGPRDFHWQVSNPPTAHVVD